MQLKYSIIRCVSALDSSCRCFICIIRPCTRLYEHLDMATLARSNMLYNCVVALIIMWCISIQCVLVREVPGRMIKIHYMHYMHDEFVNFTDTCITHACVHTL